VHLYLRRPEPARQQELFFDESGCEPEPDDEHADGFSGTTHDSMTIKRGQAKKKGESVSVILRCGEGIMKAN
jgi:hypothetical protein